MYGVEIDEKLVEGVDPDASFFNYFNCLSIYRAVKSNYKCNAIFSGYYEREKIWTVKIRSFRSRKRELLH